MLPRPMALPMAAKRKPRRVRHCSLPALISFVAVSRLGKGFLASKQARGMDGPHSWPAPMAPFGDKLFFIPAPGGLGMRNHTTADEYFQEMWKMVAKVLPYGLA